MFWSCCAGMSHSSPWYEADVVDRGLDSAALGVTPSRYDDSLGTCSHDVPSGCDVLQFPSGRGTQA